MTNKKRFFYNGMLLTAVGLAVRTVSLFFSAFVSRTVGVEGVGLQTIIMTVYSLAVTFSTSGISLTTTRLVASAVGEGKSESVGQVLRGAIIYSLAFGFVGTLLLFIGADFIANKILSDERTVAALKILSISLLPISLTSVFSGYFVGKKKVACNAAVQVVSQLSKIVFTVILVTKAAKKGTKDAVLALCISIVFTEMLSFLVMLVQLLIERRRCKYSKVADVTSVTKTAIPLALSAYVRAALLSLEHILIPKRLRDGGESNSTAVSHYGLLHGMALPIILYPIAPLSSFSGLLVPEFAESSAAGDNKRLRRIATESIDMTLVYSIMLAVMLFVFSEELGYIIYNSYEAGRFVAILAPIVPLMYLDHVTDSMLKGIGEQVFSMWVNITDSALSIALVWILIPEMGILGYALVIIIMEAYNFILSYFRLKSKIKFTINAVCAIVIPIISAVTAACFVQNLFRISGSSTTPLWLFMKLGFCVSVFVCCNTALTLMLRMRNKRKNNICA